MVIGCPHVFQRMEEEYQIDKPDTSHNPLLPRPLTQCTGLEWKRQRRQVQQALEGLPQRSLASARLCTNLSQLLTDLCRETSDGKKTIDLKEFAVQISIHWVVGLFRGRRDSKLEVSCRAFWEASRRRDPLPRQKLQKLRKAFIDSFLWNDSEYSNTECEAQPSFRGVFETLHPNRSGLSQKEANDNAVNAMIAAHDAVQALIFWTLWNMSRRNDVWVRAREVAILAGTKNAPSDHVCASQYEKDLQGLTAFKKAATSGDLVDYSTLSILARSLCETVRVFPPVWTLPRTWPGSIPGQQEPGEMWYSKVDVPTINGATHYQQWDPHGLVATTAHSTHIASFGLGKRHCPAGTAALHAVYHFLTEFLQNVKEIDALEIDGAIQSAYLLPTLSLVEPQRFTVALSKKL